MKFSLIAVLVAVGMILIAIIVLRSRRLDPEMVYVTRSEATSQGLLLEYRMAQPFEVAFVHGMRRPIDWPDEPGIHVGSTETFRSEQMAVFPSCYDWIRGEHDVQLRCSRANSLLIESGDRIVEVAPWSASDVSQVKWSPPGDRTILFDGVGQAIVLFAQGEHSEEYLMLYAGTDAQSWAK